MWPLNCPLEHLHIPPCYTPFAWYLLPWISCGSSNSLLNPLQVQMKDGEVYLYIHTYTYI